MIRVKKLILCSLSLMIGLVSSSQSMEQLIAESKKFLSSNPDSSLNLVHIAHEKALANADSLALTKTHNLFALTHRTKGENDKALASFFRSLAISERNKFELQEARTKLFIGQLFINQKKFKEAEKYLINAQKIFFQQGDSLWLCKTKGDLAGLYFKQGKTDLSISLLTESQEIGLKINNISVVNNATSNLAQVYTSIGKFEEAKKSFDMAIQVFETKKNFRDLSTVLLNKARLLYRLKKLIDSRKTVNLALEYAKKVAFINVQYQCYELLRKLSVAEGKFESALVMSDSFHLLKDSIFKLEKTVLVEELNLQYRTRETEHENTFLKKRNKLQKEILEQKRRQATYFYWIIILSIIIILVILYFAWRKNVLSRQLKAQNEALRIANEDNSVLLKELHHRVKNNFQAIKSMLDIHTDKIELKNKVEALSLVHQRLYVYKDIQSVKSKDFLQFIVQEYEQLFDEEVDIKVDIEEQHIPTEQAISMGLFLTEAMNNAFKYGLKGSENKLEVRYNDQQLVIKNNGVKKKGDEGGTFFGSTIMAHLARKLNGEIRVEEEKDNYMVSLIFGK